MTEQREESDRPGKLESRKEKKKSNRRGRGEGCIVERPDGIWMGQISLGFSKGKGDRRTVYDATKAEVMQKMRKLQAKFATGQWTDPSVVSVGSYLTDWLENIA